MPRGGKRPGAGKPKGHKSQTTLAAQEARKALIAKIHEHMDVLFTAWLDSAVGHYEEKEAFPGSGVMKIYKKGPNPIAIKEMIDRAMGKPVQPIDTDGHDPLELSKRAEELAAPFLGEESDE